MFVWTFEKREHIVQLLLLTFIAHGHYDHLRIGSTNHLTISTNPLVAFTAKLTETECPLITLEINGKTFKGMFDTSVDVFGIFCNTGPLTGPCKKYLTV